MATSYKINATKISDFIVTQPLLLKAYAWELLPVFLFTSPLENL